MDRLRAFEAQYGLEHFELGPKRTVHSTVLERVKAYELRTPTKGSSKQRDARSISDDGEEGRSSADIGDDESIQDIAMDDDEDGNASDQQWETVGRRKGKKRNRKRAAKQRDRVSEPQSMGGPSGGNRKSIKDMAEVENANTAGQGARSTPQDFLDLQGLGPAAESICRTLRKAMNELRKPVRQRDGERDLRLADEMERAVGTMQAFRAGISAERLRSAAQEGTNERSKRQEERSGPRTRSGPVRTYAEAAFAAMARPVARASTFKWEPSRTLYLAPKDPEAAKVAMEQYSFGRKLHALFPPPFNSDNLAVERLERTSTNGWKVQFAAEALQFVPQREFTVMDAGTWVPQ